MGGARPPIYNPVIPRSRLLPLFAKLWRGDSSGNCFQASTHANASICLQISCSAEHVPRWFTTSLLNTLLLSSAI